MIDSFRDIRYRDTGRREESLLLYIMELQKAFSQADASLRRELATTASISTAAPPELIIATTPDTSSMTGRS